MIILSAAAHAGLPELCRIPAAAAEHDTGVPDRLLQAIGIIESGRRDLDGSITAWPWSINVEGMGEWFETKQQAIAAVNAHRARGVRSIDVGCMQVNLMHHPDAFRTLEDAFDPATNARYAARFLMQLLAQTGSWPLAVAGYHSLTAEIGGDYAKKVLAVWAKPILGRRATQVAQTPPAGAVPVPRAGLPAALPSPARMLAMPGSAMPVMIGRGLDTYRALPTRLAAAGLFRRS